MIKTKQELLNHFSDINAMYNNPFMYQTLSNMIDELLEQQPCEDCISREDALRHRRLIHDDDGIGYSVVRVDEIIALPSVTPKTGWIPVSERLPEDEQEILFSTKTGRVQIGKYHDDDSANQWYSYRDKCRAWNNVVTAWMPLPEPYAESEDENNG